MRLACSPASKPTAFPKGERGRFAGNPSRGEGAAGAGRSGQTELRKQAALNKLDIGGLPGKVQEAKLPEARDPSDHAS